MLTNLKHTNGGISLPKIEVKVLTLASIIDGLRPYLVCPKWAFVRMDCPKPQKSTNTPSSQFNFVRPHLAEVSFEGRAPGFSVIPRSVRRIEKIKHRAPLERFELAKPISIKPWQCCWYGILINGNLASHQLANTGTREKVGSSFCLRSWIEMGPQYNHWCPNKAYH